MRKVASLRHLHELLAVPVLIAVKFGCGTIASVNITKPYRTVPHWGPNIPRDGGDIEPGARFQWDDFKRLPK